MMRARGRKLTVLVVAAAAVAIPLVVLWWAVGVPSESTTPREPAAQGWRWESYGGVELQVPDGWGHGTTGTPPCLHQANAQPYVGRPGVVPTIGCSGPPVPALDKRTSYVWFDSHAEPGVHSHDGGWVEETRTVAAMAVTVLTDDAGVRAHILRSARAAGTVDAAGCPADHAVTGGPDVRPAAEPGGLGTVGPVESITICRYAIGPSSPAGHPVLSTSRVVGEPARAIVDAILAAPQGSGPDDPDSCAKDVAYGDDVLLVAVRGGAGTREVFVRYSGCDGHGTDDGHTRRALTADVVRPLLSGPHEPSSLSGPVGALVWPTR